MMNFLSEKHLIVSSFPFLCLVLCLWNLVFKFSFMRYGAGIIKAQDRQKRQEKGARKSF